MKKGVLLAAMLGLGFAKVQAQTSSKSDTLTVYRAKINELDNQIIKLLGERMEAARAIGIYKQAHHMEVLQSARFNEVLEKAIAEGKQQGLSEEFVKALYEDIHKESIRQQEELKK
jgi:4-amino-4-deoxychorismate mutase